MRTIKYISLSLLLLISITGFAQLNRSVAPFAKDAPKFEMAKPIEFTLSNGMQMIVVENHKTPRVSFQIFVDRGPIFEGKKAGITSAVGQMMMAGTKNRTKDQLNEEIDFIGARVNASSNGVSGTSLTKHTEKVLDLMQDVLLNPIFPEEELKLYKKQALSGISAAKASAQSIASNVSSVVMYGKDHPYGEPTTEETIAAITVDDVKTYYKHYLRPNIAYIIVIGDIKAKKAKKLVEKHFAKWEKAEVKKQKFNEVKVPAQNQVAISHKPGSVQSYIYISNTVNLRPDAKDIFAVKMLQSIMGGGSDGRLYKNIREDKGFTYGAYCRFSPDLLVGNFSATAEVRNEVTDSAVVEFLHEFNRIRKEKVSNDELELHKAKFIGTFARGLERPETFASYALNIKRFGLPIDYYVSYLENINKVTADDIQAAAKKYIKPENMWIVTVGDRDMLKKVMKKFSKEKITEYDFYGNAVKNTMKPAPAGVSATSVIKTFLKAVNGDAWKKTQNFTAKGKMQITGMPMTFSMVTQVKKTDKLKINLSMGPQVVSSEIMNGDKGIRIMRGQTSPMSSEDLENSKLRAAMIEELVWSEHGIQPVLKGIMEDDGEEVYVIELTKPKKKTLYYSVKTGLKIKEISTQKGPKGSMLITSKITDYKKVGDVLFPHKMETQMGPQNITITFTETNTDPIEDKEFAIQ